MKALASQRAWTTRFKRMQLFGSEVEKENNGSLEGGEKKALRCIEIGESKQFFSLGPVVLHDPVPILLVFLSGYFPA